MVRPYGCWIYATLLGQRQTFDARLEISRRFPLQTDIRTNLCLEAFLKINPCVWCTTCVTIRKNLCFEGFRDKTFYKLESPSLRCLEGHTTTMDYDGSKDCWHWYVKVHCPFDAVSIDQQSNPEIAVGYYLEDCGLDLEAPEYIRYFLQEASMRRKCLSECCTLPKLRYAFIDDLFIGCVN